MNHIPDLDEAIERRRQLRVRRLRRLLYMRRTLLLSIGAALLAMVVLVVIWAVRSAHNNRNSADADIASDATSTTTATADYDDSAVGDGVVLLEDEIHAAHAVLYDMTDHRVIASKEADVPAFPASITKVMTLLVAVEHIEDLDVNYTLPWQITTHIDPLATVAGFNAGDVMTLRDLLYGCILPSGADAAVALADYVEGDGTGDIASAESAFADRMNRRAAELGAVNTHFTNTSGLEDTGHTTTAYDMALMMAAAMQNATCREVLMTERYSSLATKRLPASQLEGGEWRSTLFTSWLGAERYGILAGKTGYTYDAKHTLVTYTVGEDGHEYVFVSMKTLGSDKAIEDVRYVFDTYC